MILTTYGASLADPSVEVLQQLLLDPKRFDWQESEERRLWPREGWTHLSKDQRFCGVLVLVRNPSVELVRQGWARLYNEEVNVFMRVTLSTEADGTDPFYGGHVSFALRGRRFFAFVADEAVSSDDHRLWEGGQVTLGTLYTYDEGAVYREVLKLRQEARAH